MRRDAKELRVKAQPPRHERQRNRKKYNQKPRVGPRPPGAGHSCGATTKPSACHNGGTPKGVRGVHYLDQCCIDRLVRRVVYFAYKTDIPKLSVCKPTCPAVWPPGSLAHWLSACLASGHFSNGGAVTAATPAAAPSAIGQHKLQLQLQLQQELQQETQ